MSKKYILLIIFLLIFAFGVRTNYLSKKNNNQANLFNPVNYNQPDNKTPESKNIKVKLDFGEANILQATVTAVTAFEALDKTVRGKGITMKTKKYDFGIFIESIGDFANSKDKAWIYLVNGKSATQAADLQEVKSGDQLEWKYEKPTY